MSNAAYDLELEINPGESVQIRSRVTDFDGTAYTQSSFNSPGSIKYDLIRLSDGTYLRNQVVLAAASQVFNTLQSWSNDSIGYNYRHTLTAGDTDDPDEEYEYRVTFVDSSSVASILRVKITTHAVP